MEETMARRLVPLGFVTLSVLGLATSVAQSGDSQFRNPALLRTYKIARAKGINYEIDGMFYSSNREFEAAIDAATILFDANHWRLRELEHHREFAQKVQQLDDDHYRRLVQLQSLFRILRTKESDRDFAEAAKAGDEALSLSNSLFGKETVNYSYLLTFTSRAYVGLDETGRARELAKENILIQERMFGPNHPGVIISKTDLIQTFLLSSQFYDVECLARQTYDDATKMYERDNRDLFVVLAYSGACIRLANFLRIAQDLNEAEEILINLRNILQTLDHTAARKTLARSLAALASIQTDGRRYEEAEKTASEALDVIKETHGEYGLYFSIYLTHLANKKIDLDKLGEAEILLDRSRPILQTLDGDSAVNCWTATNARLALKQGRLAETVRLNKQQLTNYERQNGKEHPILLDYLLEFAAAKRRFGQEAEAAELEMRAKNIQAKLDEYKRNRATK